MVLWTLISATYSGTKPADWGQRSQFGQAQTTGGSSGWGSGSTGLAALLLLGNQIKPVGRLPYFICIYLTAMRPNMLQMNCTEYFCLDCMCSCIFDIYKMYIIFIWLWCEQGHMWTACKNKGRAFLCLIWYLQLNDGEQWSTNCCLSDRPFQQNSLFSHFLLSSLLHKGLLCDRHHDQLVRVFFFKGLNMCAAFCAPSGTVVLLCASSKRLEGKPVHVEKPVHTEKHAKKV